MKKIVVYISVLFATNCAHAKLDKMMKEVVENPSKYDTPKAQHGLYVSPMANPNYVQLVEKYLPDIKDTLYNSCAPALKRANSLPFVSLEALTEVTGNLLWVIGEYIDTKLEAFKQGKSMEEVRKTIKEEMKKWEPLTEEIQRFRKEYLEPANIITAKYSNEEKRKARAEANFYIDITGERNILKVGRWISAYLENDFCNLK